jgi:antitoxin component of MazEF toxin-antitoxin module
MPAPKVAEVRVRKVGTKAVFELPQAILRKLGARPGDMLYWASVDGTLQITKDNPRMAIPVLGCAEEKFESQEPEPDEPVDAGHEEE